MDQYKFRGKCKDTGVWLCGSFVTGGIFGSAKADCYIFVDGRFFEVIPETVGMYVGRKDKYWEEIYNGDILLTETDGKSAISIVRWHNSSCRFDGTFISPSGELLDNATIVDASSFPLYSICGNIHDNPELLNPAQGGRINMQGPNTQQPGDELKNAEANEATEAKAEETAPAGEAVGADSEEGSIEG